MIQTTTDTKMKQPLQNRILFACLFLLLATVAGSCKKDSFNENPAAVQLFNVLDNGVELYTDLSGNRPAVFGNAFLMENKIFEISKYLLYLNSFPQPVAFYSKKDTFPENGPVLSATLDLKPGAIYSLFIHGEKVAATYTLFNDMIPAINRKDSTCFVRFANFSSTQSVSVNLKDQPAGSLVQSLAARTVSEFIELPLNITDFEYDCEIRDQATGALLCIKKIGGKLEVEPGIIRLEYMNWAHRSHTLVISGHQGAAAPDGLVVSVMTHR